MPRIADSAWLVLVVGIAGCAEAAPERTTPAPATTEPIVASRDEAANVPSFVWTHPARDRTAGQGFASAEEAARAQLRAHASTYRMRVDQVDGLELEDLHDIGRGPIIARFGRRLDGIEVWNEKVSVAMDQKRDVVALGGFVTGDVPAALKGRAAVRGFSLPITRAAALAIAHAGGVEVDAAALTPRPAEGGYQEIPTDATVTPVRAKKIWFRTSDRALVDAYYLEVDLGEDSDGAPRASSYVVSATGGEILFVNDLSAHEHPVSYRVWADTTPGALPFPFDGPQGNDTTPLPGASIYGYDPGFVPANLVTLSSLTSIGVHDDWLPPGATETVGNNVDAYVDITSPDGFTPGGDFRADLSGPDAFDRTIDLMEIPNTVERQKAALTQLFYTINFLHDWYYAAGFDEQAGNAQSSNYGRGGVQGDAIRAEAQDFAFRNNAFMVTPADGARPTLQVHLWDDYSVPSLGKKAVLTQTTPTTVHFDDVGLSYGWGIYNYDIPPTALVASVPANGCTPLTGTYTGQIVLVDRGGGCLFSNKAQHAMDAGAVGVIIANVASSPSPTVAPTMFFVQLPAPAFPAMSLNLADGDTLRAAVQAGPVTIAMARAASRDGALDNQAVAHEWGHYLSGRLIFDANGLNTNMARGLGEGWADAHALLMTVREEDVLEPTNATWNGVYTSAAFSFGWYSDDPYYFGARRYPYTTDLSKNPLTFKHIDDANALPSGIPRVWFSDVNPNSEVHNTGEVWATMLWECYAALLRDTQGGSPRLTFDAARDRFRDYLVAAYKLTPRDPTLIEARDALLAVAAATDPIDLERFTTAFAKRGAGVFAVAPDRNSPTNSPVIESFSTGALVLPTAVAVTEADDVVCNADDVLDNGETGTVHVTFRNGGNQALGPTSATLGSTTPGISFPAGTTITVPASEPYQDVTASLPIAMSGAADGPLLYEITVTVPDLGAGAAEPRTFEVLGNYDVIPNASSVDTVESPGSPWTVFPSEATSGWQRTTVAANDHHWTAPSDDKEAITELRSPILDVRSDVPLVLSFRHRFSFEAPNFDGGVIEISTNSGTSYTDVGVLAGYNGRIVVGSRNPLAGRAAYVGQSAGYPAFTTKTLDFGMKYAGQAIKVRFKVASDEAVSSPGWDLDDIRLDGIRSLPFDLLVPQPAECNNLPVANAGLFQSVSELTAGPAYARTTVTLDGSASFDPDGDPLTFEWLQVFGPSVALDDPTAMQPQFTAPLIARSASPATLGFQLVVSDGTGPSAPQYVGVQVVNVNRPPVAAAGPAQLVQDRTVVTLDGSASADPDSGDVLAYYWEQFAGPPVTLSSSTAARPTFTAPDVSADTALGFVLYVNDAQVWSDWSEVTITVRHANQTPVADAGSDQTVAELTPAPDFDPITVTLDASASGDLDDDTLTFAWAQTAGPTVILSDATAATPTFTAPAVARGGTTVVSFEVTVSDGMASSTATTTVTVTDVNQPPIAVAGPARSVAERTTVTLDARGSSDPDAGDALTYAWTQTAGPGVTLSSATAAQPTFTAPDVTSPTAVTFSLVVDDGLSPSTPSTVTLTVQDVNRAPVAVAGPNQSVSELTPAPDFGPVTVTLDASASSDPDGSAVNVVWTQVAGPAVTLSNTFAVRPTFTVPAVPRTGTTALVFEVVARDGQLSSEVASTAVAVTNVNRPPLASAGAAQDVDERSLVTLDGGGSSDPDTDDVLTYAWTQTAGPQVTLSSSTAARPTFIAPEVTAETGLTFALVVSDGLTASAAGSVSITVGDVNRAPVIGVAAGQTVPELTDAPDFAPVTVTLDASTSTDPDGDELSYTWTQTAGPAVTLANGTSARPTFVAPAVPQRGTTALVFAVVASDGDLTSGTATTTVTVTDVNRAPVADAGPAQSADERTTVTLDARGSSDPDDDALTYLWTQTAGPAVTLSSATAVQPMFTAPEVSTGTDLTFSLVASDGVTASLPDTVTVTVAGVNRAPILEVGASQTVAELTASPAFGPVTVTLDASASTDPDGDTLTFAWKQTGGPAITLSGATGATPTFVAPPAQRGFDAVLSFEVVASDGRLPSATGTTTVTVTNVNRPPVADAGSAQDADERTLVTLDAGGSTDPDDDTLTYVWAQTDGPTVTLSSATAMRPTFTAPEVSGTDLTFSLIANDGLTASAPDSVIVTVAGVNRAPTADAGADRTVGEGVQVVLDGGGTDPDGDALTFRWTAPDGVTLSSTSDAAPTFVAPDVMVDTPYTFTLVVADPANAASESATVTITVTHTNRAPVADAGEAVLVRSGTSVSLAGSATDPDGDTRFGWSWAAPDGVTLNDASSATPSFVAPAVTSDTTLTFTLVATDSLGLASAPATVAVTVQRALQSPRADAGSAMVATSGEEVTLDGTKSSDPDGLALTYRWTQIDGPAVVLDGDTTAQPTFMAPDVDSEVVLTFELVVSNADEVASTPARVSVFVGKVAAAADDGCQASGRGAATPAFLLLALAVLVVLRRRVALVGSPPGASVSDRDRP